MMPDGDYRMSQAQVAESIDESSVYALRFLALKDSKAFLGKDYPDYTPEQIEVEPRPGQRSQSRLDSCTCG